MLWQNGKLRRVAVFNGDQLRELQTIPNRHPKATNYTHLHGS